MRHLTGLDKVITNIDLALQTLIPPAQRATQRPHPDAELNESQLNDSQKKHIAGLMRVNHAGEVCAQALYQGQALTAQLEQVRDKMTEAALEEVEHLAWCEKRLSELNSQPSRLNPVWYLGSLMIGAFAGLIGDKWSLGFVVETERQVVAHLQKHLTQLPLKDEKSKAIIEQMIEDENNHATLALNSGGAELPPPIKILMGYVSKIMTQSAYHI